MGDTKCPAKPGTVLSQTINGAPAETLPRMLPCPIVHAATSTQDACPGLLALYYNLLSYSSRSLLRSSPGKQSPLCLLSLESLSSFAVVVDSRAISFMAAITWKASVKRKEPWIGSQPASGSITVLATHELGGPGKPFLLPERPALFCHHQKALKCISENNPSTGTIALPNDTTSSPSFPLSFFLSSLELKA